MAEAKRHKVEIIGDIELLGRAQRNARYLGITGTNGKSTTTALIGHILEMSGRAVAVGGNLGTPVLTLEPLDLEGLYVLEMSSYQLELTLSITFDVAVLLNISPDHLERHGGFEGYVAAKRRIFHRQTKPRTVGRRGRRRDHRGDLSRVEGRRRTGGHPGLRRAHRPRRCLCGRRRA